MNRFSGLRIISLFLLVITFHFPLFAKYSGGNGTSDDPYQIGTAVDLQSLANDPTDWNGRYFDLVADIDMAGQNFTPIGSTINVFSGFFNGKKHTISNLTVTPVLVDGLAQKGTGLFGAFSGTLTNLGIININIDVSGYQNSSRVGAFAGELISGSITNCYAEGGTITAGSGGWTGGLVGVLFSGGNRTIEDCYSSVSVTAAWRSAGVVGCTRGEHKLNRLAFYGSISTGLAIVEVHNDGTTDKSGIAPTNCVFKATAGLADANATGLDATALLVPSNYPSFDFNTVWKMDAIAGFAILNNELIVPELNFFERLKTERVESDPSIVWKNFGPGMSGYNEEYWCHPSDTNAMFMGPDMHVTYGSWDNGKSWQTVKDCDGDGLDLERVNDMTFSSINPDYGVAIERRGKVFETNDRGKTWTLVYLIPHAAVSPWYNAHSRIVIDPQNDDVWYIGAGGFWDVKSNFRSQASPQGLKSDIYAYGYILKTIDRGKTWRKIATDISNDLDVGRILINPLNSDIIMIATGQGMFRSIDGGETWSPSNTGLPNNLPKDLCAYYDSNTNEYVLYTVEQSVYTETGNTISTQGGVFKSTDGGVSWSSITGNLGLDFTRITNSTFRSSYAKAVAYWLGTTSNIITAKDYPTQTLQVFRRIVVNPKNKNEVYLMLNQRHDRNFGPGEIWKTEDGGTTWKITARHGNYWISATDKAYWQSKGIDSNANMKFAHLQASIDDDIESSSGCRHLAINTNGQLFIGMNQQTFRSDNSGKSWQQVDDYETAPGSNAWVGSGDSDLPGRFILSNTGVPGKLLLCSGEHGLWETTDLGNYPDKDAVAVKQIEGQVHDVNGNHGAHSISTVAVHPNDPNTIYILAWRQEHRGWLRKTTDGGKTWNNIAHLFDSDNALHEETASQNSLLIDPVTPTNMYFTATYKPISCGTNSGPGPALTLGQYGVHRSTDGGNNWTVINNGLPANASINRIIMDPENPSVLYAAVNQWGNNDVYGLYKTTNKGDNWEMMVIPSTIRSVNNVFIDPNTKYMYISCGARTGAADAGGVYRSKDNGANWNLLFDAPYVWYAETSPVNPAKILVNAAGQVGGAFKNPGFYLSQDDGKTWSKINTGIGQPDKMVDIEFDPLNENIMYAAAWGSGWFKAMIPYNGVKAVCPDAEVKEKQQLTLYGSGSLGTQLEYEWIGPEGILLSSNNQNKISFVAPEVLEDSTLIFKLTVKNNQATDTKEVRVKVTNDLSTAINNSPEKAIRVYPNPIYEDRLNVVGIDRDTNYEISDIQGRLVQKGVLSADWVDVSKLRVGIYLFRIQEDSGIVVEKIVRN